MKTMTVINPDNNEKVGEVPVFSGEEISEMVDKAYCAQPSWNKVPIHERATILYKFCDSVISNREEIGALTAKEMGKPIEQGIGECISAPEIGKQHIEKAKHLYGSVFPDSMQDCEEDLVFTRHEPLGVVAAVIPFNYPIEMVIQKVVPSLVMGNTVLVKAPSSNPLTIKKLVDLAHEAGVPKDAAQFIAGDRDDCTEHLLKNPQIAAIALTGSAQTGSEMYRNAAPTIKKMFLELGGNDAFIIREDADIDDAVEQSIGGRLAENMGQICCAIKRFIVHNSIKDAYTEKLIEKIKELKHGSALDTEAVITCLISDTAAKRIEGQIDKTVKQGAKLVYGGTIDGAHIEPAVLTGVTKDMDVAKDMEIFGPVFPIIGFDDDDEAIEIANNSIYGLSGGILTKDIMKGLDLANKMQASGVVVNGCGTYRHNEQPWGGYKASGVGNEGVLTTVEEYCRIKTFSILGAFPR